MPSSPRSHTASNMVYRWRGVPRSSGSFSTMGKATMGKRRFSNHGTHCQRIR